MMVTLYLEKLLIEYSNKLQGNLGLVLQIKCALKTLFVCKFISLTLLTITSKF